MIDTIINQITRDYASLSIDTKNRFKKSLKLLELPKGSLLVEEGKYTNTLFYIYKGSAKSYHIKDGKTITDWFAFEGEFICAINGYFLKEPSEYYIELTENSTLLELKRESLSTLSKNHHDFERFSRITITRIMLQLKQRTVNFQFTTAKERYNYLLENYPGIELRISLGDIASYIGVTQETLSRIRTTGKRI